MKPLRQRHLKVPRYSILMIATYSSSCIPNLILINTKYLISWILPHFAMINTLPITIPKLSLQVNNASPTNSATEYSPRISFSRSISQLSLEYNGTIKTINKSDDLPNEILWMIFNYISKSCRRSKSYKDLLYCSRVDKR